MRDCFDIVIASEAKQSRVFPRRDSGLLRSPRYSIAGFGARLGLNLPMPLTVKLQQV
jgi:hypothetical protein